MIDHRLHCPCCTTQPTTITIKDMEKSPSTPPQQASCLHSTPVHPGSRTTHNSFGLKYHDRDSTFEWLSKEMSCFFIGPMPAQEFLDTFLPPSEPLCGTPLCTFEPKRGMFSDLVGVSLESILCTTFVCFRTLLFPKINPAPGRACCPSRCVTRVSLQKQSKGPPSQQGSTMRCMQSNKWRWRWRWRCTRFRYIEPPPVSIMIRPRNRTKHVSRWSIVTAATPSK
jgi:hypothetical protein